MGGARIRISWSLCLLALLAAVLVGCAHEADHDAADVDAAAEAVDEAGSVDTVQDEAFYSTALGRQLSYLLWLPPGYDDEPDRRFPVLYLLHGIGGDNREWLGYGVDEAAACLLAAGRIQPFLMVLPQGDEAYWLNHAGGPRWGDAIADDLVPQVDATYRTLPDRASRAIGGLSMGGHGALQLAFNHPDVFGVAGAHSPTLRPRAEAPYYFADAATFAKVDPITLARRAEGLGTLDIWLDAGDADPWLPRIELLHKTLDDRDVPHAWHVWEGDHESEYWTAHVPDYLSYYSQVLAGEKGRGQSETSGLLPACGKASDP
ncbi:MAG TPA: alpha/beta hydrolase-fold protein [Chloroflexota bacterium]|jgi:enterochelin esterase-like enzyme